MKNILIATALLFAQQTISAQTATEVVQKIHDAQSKLKTISYSLMRQDTFVTGDTRMVSGKAKLQINKSDKIFGFDYWGKRDDFNNETIFDGNSVVQVDHDKKTYEINTSPVMIEHSTGSPGGQMVIEDLAFLDASKATD